MSPAREIPLRRLRLRPRGDSFVDRLVTIRRRWRLLLRLSLATSIAYFVATELLDHEQAFFAPIAAIVALISGGGARVRTVLELVFGKSVV